MPLAVFTLSFFGTAAALLLVGMAIGVDSTHWSQTNDPVWIGDDLNREHVMPGGAFVDADAVETIAGVDVTVATDAAAGDTSVDIEPLDPEIDNEAGRPLIPAGTTLRFASGEFATLSAAAYSGDGTLEVEALDNPVSSGNTATHNHLGRIQISAGTPLGRTQSEMENDAAFTPADPANDDEIYLTVYSKFDLRDDPGVELLRPGTLIYYNHLPGWDGFSADLQSALRDRYEVQKGVA
jgi:hypothetical protein